MKKIDLKSINGLRLNRAEAKKLINKILNEFPNALLFSKHGARRLNERNLDLLDILNVLKAGKILIEPELILESWRYRVETNKIVVIVAFGNSGKLILITAWRI